MLKVISVPRLITAENIETAEKLLSISYQVTPDQRIIAERAGVEPEALDNLLKHHKQRLFNPQTGYMPNLDPRIEPALMTMMMHFFAVGAIANRIKDEL